MVHCDRKYEEYEYPMFSGIGQGNNLALPSSSAARPAMVGAFTMDVTGNDTPCGHATAVMTHVLSKITTQDVRLLGFISGFRGWRFK